MTRMSKQGERRAQSYKRPSICGPKTGPKKDNLKQGYKVHANALGDTSTHFIPKIK